MNTLAPIGHNNPPPAEVIEPTRAMLAAWLDEHPVVLTQEDANDAGATIDRANRALKDLEGDRDALVRPLNTRVKEINAKFREASDPVERLISEVDKAKNAWILKEEARRRRVAEETRAKAAEIERIAREKLAAEEAARADAAAGVLDAGVGDAIAEADAALADADKAARAAVRAERETKVRVSGGIGRATGLRTHTDITVENIGMTLKSLLTTEKRVSDFKEMLAKYFKAEIVSYEKEHGTAPAGVIISRERR